MNPFFFSFLPQEKENLPKFALLTLNMTSKIFLVALCLPGVVSSNYVVKVEI
jgi:hypothetical protein